LYEVLPTPTLMFPIENLITDLLADQLEKAIAKYPKANAVLVRRHGVYVWGDSWEQAKTQCEAFDYLFKSAIELRKIGIDCTQVPMHGTYRVNDEDEPLSKRQKTGFNGVGKVENAQDLASNPTPILPRDAKHLLLDIEGCTTSISFVKDALFPFVLERLDAFVDALDPTEFNALAESLRADLTPAQVPEINDTKDCASMVRYMVKNDLKVASLKALQGRIWKDGYERGDLKGHVFSDLLPMLQWMTS
jgi:methylthioribulose 1-phosphate dehydratase/enolase-phosphatase E1